MSVSSDTGDDDLASVLAACDEALADGTLPPLATSESLSPEQSRLLKGLECVRMMRDVWRRPAPTLSVSGSNLAPRSHAFRLVVPTTIGRFQIVREIGRGGFGVVFLAFDRQVGRSVALKIPRPDIHLTPQLRERFRLEAHAAGGLDHPSIVPVYEAGEADDVTYIATAYCPGVTLARWLETRKQPVPIRLAADLVAQLADGVAHAHARNILHRDLKPANVMLWSPDATDSDSATNLVAKITDFGLAKSFGDAENDLTATGAILGTPSYLAPEQAGGKADRLSPATDVYGLGALLYEILVRRPPFDGENALRTLDLVRFQEPVSPRRLRPQVPRDLETICLKCLQKNPTRRYATAAALSADLRLFLEGKAILARPISSAERVWRWARRNPIVSGLAIALLLAITLGVLGIVYQWQRAKSEARQARSGEENANAAKIVAQTERNKALAKTREARNAVEQMTDAGIELAGQPDQQKAARKIIEKAITFYEGFVADQSDDAEVILEAANAFSKVCLCRERLGELDLAAQAARRSIELYDMARSRGIDDADELLRAHELMKLGGLCNRLGSDADSTVAFDAALAEFRRFCARSPLDLSLRVQLANCLMNFGVTIEDDFPNRAEAMNAEALAIDEEALACDPRDPGVLCETALARSELGWLLWKRDNSSRSRDLFQSSLEIFQQLVRQLPKDQMRRWYLSRNERHNSMVAAGEGRFQEADALFDSALKRLDELRTEYAGNFRYPLHYLDTLVERGMAQQQAGKTNDAEATYKLAMIEYGKLAAHDSGSRRIYRFALTNVHANYWKLLIETGRQSEAAQYVQRIERSKRPDWFVLCWVARVMSEANDAKSRDPAVVLRMARKATELDSNPEVWVALGEVQLRIGDPNGALVSLDKAAGLWPTYSPEVGLLRALAKQRLSETAAALAYLTEARQWLDANGTLDQDVQRLLPEALDTIQGTAAPVRK